MNTTPAFKWLNTPAAGATVEIDDWLTAVINSDTLALKGKATCYLIANYLDDDNNCHLNHQAIARGIVGSAYSTHKTLTWLNCNGWLKPSGPNSYTPSLPAGAA